VAANQSGVLKLLKASAGAKLADVSSAADGAGVAAAVSQKLGLTGSSARPSRLSHPGRLAVLARRWVYSPQAGRLAG